ncbi:hypothetical protein IYY11_05435 [Methylocystis sp. H62]|uniref:surface-adhesin E family protein n=1 Tax=Methylocystis sp. H62 TaxID=2785789 RepID=UPI0018C1D9BB|nr:surface-adhesin E family protein [Methylocystis sp. H62]MBG0792846.1 hypothetical protein [Methylocystis sp. H62]
MVKQNKAWVAEQADARLTISVVSLIKKASRLLSLIFIAPLILQTKTVMANEMEWEKVPGMDAVSPNAYYVDTKNIQKNGNKSFGLLLVDFTNSKDKQKSGVFYLEFDCAKNTVATKHVALFTGHKGEGERFLSMPRNTEIPVAAGSEYSYFQYKFCSK